MKKCVSILVLIAITFISACTAREPEIDNGETEKVIDLQLNVPGIETKTRAIGADQERAINSVYLLAFKVEGESETFDYAAVGTIGSMKNGIQTISVKVEVKSYDQRFVVITNANSEVATVVGTTEQGVAKATMLAGLEVSQSGGWNAASTSNYDALPMWGESTPVNISVTPTIPTIDMLRMVAKIDVQLDTENNNTDVTSVFRLKSVHLYNTNTKGRIVPDLVTAPTIPSFSPTQPILSRGPISYTDFDPPGVENVAMRGAIYLFETAAAAANDKANATSLVIGGVYGANPDPDAPQTYYRVNFREEDGSFSDIVRNHRYLVNITKVSGNGYETVEDAFDGKSENMEVSIISWSEGGNSNVGEEQYTLRVSENEFIFDAHEVVADSGGNLLDIYTNATSGWSVEKIVDATTGLPDVTWLTLSSNSGAAGVKKTVIMTAEVNNDATDRSAKVWISAGKLSVAVTVRQEAVPLYVGYFGGELKKNENGVWKFERPLYVQRGDEAVGVKWSTLNTNGIVTNRWNGKFNTLYIRQLSTRIVASNLCFEKNRNYTYITGVTDPDYIWYLPAQKQLIAIYGVQNSFGENKLYDTDSTWGRYWSVSEVDNTKSWELDFYYGIVKGNHKNVGIVMRVRCVRETIKE